MSKPPDRKLKADRRPPPPKRKSWRLRVGPVFGWLFTLAIWGVVGLLALLAYFAYDLPDLNRLNQLNRHPSVTLQSADGVTLASFGDLYGDFIPLPAMAPMLPKAVLATEDRRFYSHFGIDPLGLARAMFANLRAGHIVQGGSTITQQLAKNVFLAPERTLKRKVQELLLALWLERKFSKAQILSLYLNRVYFGAGTYGIDAASERYFGKSARSLNLAEAAMLAGLLKAPSRYAPTGNLAGARERAAQVLDNMVAAGAITPAQSAAAKAQPAAVVRPDLPLRNARYFADWVLDAVNDYVGNEPQDLVVVTTLDQKLQSAAEKAIETVLAKDGGKRDAAQAALVALGDDGAVRALVGGRDYRDSAFNRATQAKRQPGSAFKLFVYLAGFEAGLSPDSTMVDGPISIGNWQPKNTNNRYIGNVSLRQAFAHSINTVAVQVSEKAGRRNVIAVAHRLGITQELEANASIALGTGEVTLLELTGAYAAVANGGMGVLPYGIREIRTREGRVLFRRSGSGPGRVIDADIDRQLNDLLSAVVEDGTGKAARLDRPAAGKTGTSQDFRDAWFVGYTANLVAGVWVGNDNDEAMNRVTGGSLPAHIWHDFMTAGLAGAPVEPLLANAPAEARTTKVVVRDPGDQGLWNRIIRQFGQGASPGSGSGDSDADLRKRGLRPPGGGQP